MTWSGHRAVNTRVLALLLCGISAPALAARSTPDNNPQTNRKEDPRARAEYFRFERAFPFGSVPAGARRRAWESAQPQGKLPRRALTPAWRPSR